MMTTHILVLEWKSGADSFLCFASKQTWQPHSFGCLSLIRQKRRKNEIFFYWRQTENYTHLMTTHQLAVIVQIIYLNHSPVRDSTSICPSATTTTRQNDKMSVRNDRQVVCHRKQSIATVIIIVIRVIKSQNAELNRKSVYVNVFSHIQWCNPALASRQLGWFSVFILPVCRRRSTLGL